MCLSLHAVNDGALRLTLGTSAAGVTVREEPMARHSSDLLAWSKLAKRASVEIAVLTACCVGIVWLALWKVFSKVDNGIFQLSPALGIVTPPPYRTGREGVSWY